MLRREKEKTAALVLTAAIVVLYALDVPPLLVGAYSHGGAWWDLSYGRLTYHFFHASFLHLVFNLWCFLSCVFYANVSLRDMFLAWVVASSVPLTSSAPTVGLSGVCCALLGFIMWRATDKLRYNAHILACLALPAIILPGVVNSLCHFYCYFVAVAIGCLPPRLRNH